MIETIDEYYGIVLDALEAAGQDLDEWIIIYTSDHGEMLGASTASGRSRSSSRPALGCRCSSAGRRGSGPRAER